ncbi:MAG: hypothetical protein ACIAS6_04360 [Phycisphaerales bacterium JB060]
MPRQRLPHPSRLLPLIAAGGLAAGCAQHVRIPDAPPAVDTQPVTQIAGFGMELRVWALDATSWKRARNNAELERLYRAWLAIEAQRDANDEDAPDEDQQLHQAGPPTFTQDQEPETFEAFVAAKSQPQPEQPGLESLQRYADTRDTLDDAAERIWNENGLRFALVPIDQLAALRDSMGVPGPLERTWWGATTSWSHMAKGVAFESHRLETDAGPLVLGSGRLALIGRAWPAPGVKGSVLRVEFCPQFVRTDPTSKGFRSRLTSRLEAENGPPSDLDAGPVFQRLLLRGSIPRGYALVITASSLDQSPHQVGPMLTGSSIGQAALSTVGPDGALRPVALVVVPVLPEWFSLSGG